MNIAMPFATADSTTEPSNESATRMTTLPASATPGPTTRSGAVPGDAATIAITPAYRTSDVDRAHAAGAACEAAEQQLGAADRAHHEWLQQPAFGVAADRAERQEHGEHGPEEQRSRTSRARRA